MSVRVPFMKVGSLQAPRPVVEVNLEGLREYALPCLVDSGSLNSLFAAWTAREAGLTLQGAPEKEIAVAGRAFIARFATARFFIGAHTWEAEVGFCDDWPWDHHVLGLRGFFRWFDVTISGAAQTTTLVPMPD